MRSGRCDDIRSAARSLHPEATENKRANGRGKARARFLWFLQSAGRPGHSAPLAGISGFLCFLTDRRGPGFPSEITVLSRRRSIFGFPLTFAAGTCAFYSEHRPCRGGPEG